MIRKLICKLNALRTQPEAKEEESLINETHREIIRWYANDDSAAGVIARKVLRDEALRVATIRGVENHK